MDKKNGSRNLQDETRYGNPEINGMSEIVKNVCIWVEGFIFLFGCYIVLFGHLTPGGGFAGGVIAAGSFILITLAFGRGRIEKIIGRRKSSILDSLGALMFLFIGWAGIYTGGVFFSNFIQKKFGSMPFRFLSAGNIPLINIAIGIKVMSAIFLVFFVLSITRVVLRGDKLEMVRKK
ncbi:MAG: hypothetical protein J7L54_00385 [Elusimicrobia bacterium]|nr:hypothetical protein [Elusimicrobiota bacterium]